MQTIRFKSLPFIAASMFFFLLITSCKKEVDSVVTDPPVTQELLVQFSNVGVPIADVDSIMAVVRNENHEVKKLTTLQKVSNAYKASLEGLGSGKYNAEILFYSKKRSDHTARQFALVKNLELPLKQTAAVNAPAGNFTDNWFERAVFFEGEEDVVIVAMDPRDSYYAAYFNHAKWKWVRMERYSIQVNYVVARKSSVRNITGLIGFGEYADYTSYVQMMAGKNWTKGVISGYIENGQGDELSFEYEYYKN